MRERQPVSLGPGEPCVWLGRALNSELRREAA
jgi:hypothetical protein